MTDETIWEHYMTDKAIQLFKNKYQCCGCNACEMICGKKAITMIEDEYGFRFPQIDTEKCVGCGSCQKVCCINNDVELCKPRTVYAASYKNKDISAKSASGGIFAALAKQVLTEGGIVFGSAYTKQFDVEVISIEKIEDLPRLQGSKYVQSSMNSSFLKIKSELQTGRTVLFCGVPCQVEALKRFLGRSYENLLVVDIVCHGVPSNRMLKDYLAFLADKKQMEIQSIQFRTKTKGQNVYGEIAYRQFSHTGEIAYRQEPLISYKSSYYKLFLNCQTFRDSCYHCKFAGTKRPGDISLCDYWGIEDEHPDFVKEVEKEGLAGISAIMVNTNAGLAFFERLKQEFLLRESTVEQVAKHNPQLQAPSVKTAERKQVMDCYRQSGYQGVDDFYFKKYRMKILTSDIGQVLPNSWKKKILQVIRGKK
jgi:coenzyme F420-reducing hydrogenase beta subunit